jgi:hypothetical protein
MTEGTLQYVVNIYLQNMNDLCKREKKKSTAMKHSVRSCLILHFQSFCTVFLQQDCNMQLNIKG